MARRFYREEPEAAARHEVEGATPGALAALCAYGWPGNIRELRNVIFEALVHKRAVHVVGSLQLAGDLAVGLRLRQLRRRHDVADQNEMTANRGRACRAR